MVKLKTQRIKSVYHPSANPNKFGFTLAELLIAILISAVILTLLAPVITKRRNDTTVSTGNTGTYKSKLYTYDTSNPDCTQAPSMQNTLNCNFTVPTGVNKINAVVVSPGGGGAGATLAELSGSNTLKAANSVLNTAQTKEMTIDSNMKNVTISYLSGSGAGGGGASWVQGASGPQSQSECDKYTSIFIPAQYNGGKTNVCVSKYNVGDTNGPSVVSSTRRVALKTNCTADECCWYPTSSTNSSDKCSTSGSWNGHSTDYNGCKRTLCTWYAANTACKWWAPSGTRAGDWRLPKPEEMAAWGQNINMVSRYLGSDGLQLCDNVTGATTTYGSLTCGYGKYATGSYLGGECYPAVLWSSEGSGTKYTAYILFSSKLKDWSTWNGRTAFSARCVYDGGSAGASSNSVSSGGGGGAGAYIKNYQIPSNIITSNIGGKIVLYAAAGGSGGNSASSQGSSASNGSNGSTSYIEIYDKDNVLKWGLRAPGGNYGYGATTTSFGNGGDERAINACQLYENGAWKNINCTGAGLEGNNGVKNESASSTSTANGGNGAGSLYNSTNATGGGSGGNVSSANGYNGTLYGAGGGGATVTFNSSNNSTAGKGGSGANGVAEITYDKIYQAAAGGGGGGGAFVHLENISVTSGNTYVLQVGKGGDGGAISANGTDGGESGVTFGSITYSLSGGKGGKVGTPSNETSEAVNGLGGAKGLVSSNVSDTSGIVYKNGENGLDAAAFTKDDVHANSSGYGGSYGGVGGASGLDSIGGCGGLFIDSTICTNTSINGTSGVFAAPVLASDGVNLGSAGSGGGGGGWSQNTVTYPNPGSGASGLDGYVFIYWLEN